MSTLQSQDYVGGPRVRKLPRPFRLFAGTIAVLVVLVIVGPLLLTVQDIFFPGWTPRVSDFLSTWTRPALTGAIRNTVILVAGGISTALIFGCLFAWLNERTDARIGWVTETLPVMPLFVPQIALGIGWIFLATPGPGLLNVAYRTILGTGGEGPFNIFSWPGLLFLYGIVLLPDVYLTVSAAFRNLDPSLEEASRMSGAGLMRTLSRVTVPAIRAATLSGTLLAVSAGFALFSIPVLIGTPARIDILTVRIVHMVTSQYPADFLGALTLGLVIVFFVGATWIAQRRIARVRRHSTIGGRAGGTSNVRLGPLRIVARCLMLGYLLVAVVLPLAALLYVSVQKYWSSNFSVSNLTLANYRELFEPGQRALEALRYSLLLGLLTAFIGMAIAAILAYYLANRPDGWISKCIDGVTKLPSAVSHVVVAVAILAALAGPPFGLHGTIWILLIAYVVLYMPHATISADAAMAQVGRAASEASRMNGAGEGKTLRRVVGPLMLPGLLAGWVLVFVHGVGDVTASVLLASAHVPVLSFVMLDFQANGTFGVLASMGAVMTVVTSGVSVLVLVVGKRRSLHKRTRANVWVRSKWREFGVGVR